LKPVGIERDSGTSKVVDTQHCFDAVTISAYNGRSAARETESQRAVLAGASGARGHDPIAHNGTVRMLSAACVVVRDRSGSRRYRRFGTGRSRSEGLSLWAGSSASRSPIRVGREKGATGT
jgi:hypothetical protein